MANILNNFQVSDSTFVHSSAQDYYSTKTKLSELSDHSDESKFIQSSINCIFDSRGTREDFARVKMFHDDFQDPSVRDTYSEFDVTEERDQFDDIYDLMLV